MTAGQRSETEAKAEAGAIGLFVPAASGPAEAVADRFERRHPAVAAMAVTVSGWLLLSATLLALGLALQQWVFDGPIGRWDEDVTRWFADRRTPTWDDLTAIGSSAADTLTIVAGVALLAIILLVRKLWREALFVVLALTLEVATFLTTTMLVERDRPPVAKLDAVPPTSSYPSGHTAAAVAFYVALALIVTNRVRSTAVRVLVWVLAVAVPLAVLVARIYRGMHHPTDVMVGVVLGLLCLAVALLAVRSAAAVAARHEAAGRAVEGVPVARLQEVPR